MIFITLLGAGRHMIFLLPISQCVTSWTDRAGEPLTNRRGQREAEHLEHSTSGPMIESGRIDTTRNARIQLLGYQSFGVDIRGAGDQLLCCCE